MTQNYRPVWAEVDLSALKHNLKIIKNYTASEIMPIVKANAYGHGAVEVVRALKNEGIKRFGVAFLEEALELRRHFPDLNLMIIGPTLPQYSDILVKEDLIPEICQYKQAEALSAAAVKLKKTIRIHIKIDTGMGRIGLCEEALEEIKKMFGLPGLFLEGIYTHLATADSPDLAYAYQQLAKFDNLYRQLKKEGIIIPLRHVANSSAILRLPESHYELCRPGIILYGQLPASGLGEKAGFKPVMSLKAKIVHLKTIETGESVSYGRSFVATRPTRVATLPLGYADGLRRDLSNRWQVIVNGKKAPIIGKVCMDQTMIDVTEIEDVKLGDEVVLIGDGQYPEISAGQMAKMLDTISYEILCGIGQRVPRIYTNP